MTKKKFWQPDYRHDQVRLGGDLDVKKTGETLERQLGYIRETDMAVVISQSQNIDDFRQKA